RQTDRALAEDGDRLAALQIDPLQGTPGRPGAARDRRTGDERERIGQRHQRRDRYLHVPRVTAVAAGAEDDGALETHLRPSRPAVLAGAAAVVVMVHDALADARFLLGDARADGGHDAAGLVAGDHAGRPSDTAGHSPARVGRGAIVVQVAAAHARGLDF